MQDRATYREPIGRFVVEYLERLPEEYEAELRLAGIDPEDNWLLEYSTEDYGNAEEYKLEQEESSFSKFRSYRVRDRGEDSPRFIERILW